MKEIWKWVPDYQGTYKISNKGRVKSVARSVLGGNGAMRHRPELIMKIGPDQHGYLKVNLYDIVLKKQKVRKVHQLVLEAFRGPRPSTEHFGCHKDGNYLNNCPKNLKWGTREDNAEDSIRHGTFNFSGNGSKNPNSVLTEKEVKKIWMMIRRGARSIEIGPLFGVSKYTIENIRFGRNWNHITQLPITRRAAKYASH